MSTSQRVVKNTVFLYIRTIVSLLVSVYTTRVLLQALGESDYGLYNVVGGAVSMLGFLSASMSSATQRFLSYAEGTGEKENIIRYFNNAIVIHQALALLMVVVFALAAIVLFNGTLNIPDGRQGTTLIIYICMIVSMVFSVTIVPYDAEINAHENMLFYSLLGILDVVFKLTIALSVLAFHKDKLIFYAVLMALESFLLRNICRAYCRKHYEECRHVHLRKYADRSVIREMTSFAGWNLANIGTGMVSLFGMNLVVNHYFGTTVNAAMGIATQLSGVMMGLSMNMNKAVTPILVKSEGGKQRNRMLDITYVSCKFSYLVFSLVCIPVLVYLQPLLSLWLTIVPKWTNILCVILIVSTLFEQLSVILYQSIMAEGHIKGYNVSRSITNLLPLLISVYMFQCLDLPPFWALINWGVFKAFIGGCVNVYYAKKRLGFGVTYYLKSIVAPCLIGTLVAFVCSLAFWVGAEHHLYGWFFGFLFSTIIGLPIYWVLTISSSERQTLLSMFDSTKSRIRS